MAGGRVADQEPDRPPLLDQERLPTAMIDHDPLGPHRLQRHRDVKIVPVGVKRQIIRLAPRPRAFEDRLQLHAIPLPLGMEPRDVLDLKARGERGQVGKGQSQRSLHGAIDNQDMVAAHDVGLPEASVGLGTIVTQTKLDGKHPATPESPCLAQPTERHRARWPGSTGCVIVEAIIDNTAPANDVHDPGDRNAPVDAVLQRLLRRERHRAGRRARDVLRVPGAQRRGEVDDDQDADGTARPFRRADVRAGTEHARPARGAGGEAPHGGHSRRPGTVRQPDGARVSHVRRPHPSDAAGHDPQPLR